MSAPVVRVIVYLDDDAADDRVRVTSYPGGVSIVVGASGGVDINLVGSDVAERAERLLNRLRFELAAQVVRGGQ